VKHVCYDAGWEPRYDPLWANGQEDVLNSELPLLADEVVMHSGASRYDAILIVEGQEYRPLRWKV